MISGGSQYRALGRTINLAPTYIYVSQANYTGYFILLGLIMLPLIPLYLVSKNNKRVNSK